MDDGLSRSLAGVERGAREERKRKRERKEGKIREKRDKEERRSMHKEKGLRIGVCSGILHNSFG